MCYSYTRMSHSDKIHHVNHVFTTSNSVRQLCSNLTNKKKVVKYVNNPEIKTPLFNY